MPLKAKDFIGGRRIQSPGSCGEENGRESGPLRLAELLDETVDRLRDCESLSRDLEERSVAALSGVPSISPVRPERAQDPPGRWGLEGNKTRALRAALADAERRELRLLDEREVLVHTADSLREDAAAQRVRTDALAADLACARTALAAAERDWQERWGHGAAAGSVGGGAGVA